MSEGISNKFKDLAAWFSIAEFTEPSQCSFHRRGSALFGSGLSPQVLRGIGDTGGDFLLSFWCLGGRFVFLETVWVSYSHYLEAVG